jgi:nucleoside-diphosphate-sugar epimerase
MKKLIIGCGYVGRRLAELLKAPPPRYERPIGAVLPPHERAHRRVSNKRMRGELGVKPTYPSYRDGLKACFDM